MCGILVTKNPNKTLLLKHRGLESHMEYHHGKYFCHHRLPIQTEFGDNLHQPIKVGRYFHMLYNGEIFNYDTEKWDSDVEYLVDFFGSMKGLGETFEQPKIDEINTWDGFWSIVLYGDEEDAIVYFTDPLGKKQLYRNDEGELCSEISPLILDENDLDMTFKSQVAKWGYNTNDRTPYNHIKRVHPNNMYFEGLGIDTARIVKENYYDLSPIHVDNPVEYMQEELRRSVSSRLISKTFDVGFLISGGIDSTVLLALLREMNGIVHSFSIANSEDHYVDVCESYFNMEIERLRYSIVKDEDISQIYKWSETPIDLGSVVPQFHLFSVIPQRIVLSGDGADELFGGYKRIHEYDSQGSDIFDELTYYHLPRLDRASMRYTIELRNPYLSYNLIRFAQGLPLELRTDKKIIKDAFGDMIPREILERKKHPLKNPQIVKSKKDYQKRVLELFYDKRNKV